MAIAPAKAATKVKLRPTVAASALADGRSKSCKRGEAAASHEDDDTAKTQREFGKDVKAAQELLMEQQEAECKMMDGIANFVAVNQEVALRVLAVEERERQRRDAEEGLARSKPLSSTTLEERRQVILGWQLHYFICCWCVQAMPLHCNTFFK